MIQPKKIKKRQYPVGKVKRRQCPVVSSLIALINEIGRTHSLEDLIKKSQENPVQSRS